MAGDKVPMACVRVIAWRDATVARGTNAHGSGTALAYGKHASGAVGALDRGVAGGPSVCACRDRVRLRASTRATQTVGVVSEPLCVMGHSAGEFVAAVACGAMELFDGARILVRASVCTAQ